MYSISLTVMYVKINFTPNIARSYGKGGSRLHPYMYSTVLNRARHFKRVINEMQIVVDHFRQDV
jgi:hypothetical protein